MVNDAHLSLPTAEWLWTIEESGATPSWRLTQAEAFLLPGYVCNCDLHGAHVCRWTMWPLRLPDGSVCGWPGESEKVGHSRNLADWALAVPSGPDSGLKAGGRGTRMQSPYPTWWRQETPFPTLGYIHQGLPFSRSCLQCQFGGFWLCLLTRLQILAHLKNKKARSQVSDYIWEKQA